MKEKKISFAMKISSTNNPMNMTEAMNRRRPKFVYLNSRVTTHGTNVMRSAPELVKHAGIVYT